MADDKLILVIKEELKVLFGSICDDNEYIGVAKTLLSKTIPIMRVETLREVGEWLARYYDVTSPSELKRELKEGRLPGEK